MDLSPVVNYLLTCPHCSRKILVTAVLNGSNHNISVLVACGDCLKTSGVDPQWKANNPAGAKEIEDWLAS